MCGTERAMFLHKARRTIVCMRTSMRNAYVAVDDTYDYYFIVAYTKDEDPAVKVKLELTKSFPGTPETFAVAVKVDEPTGQLRSCKWVFTMQEDDELVKRVHEWKTHSDVGKALADVEQLLDLIEAQSFDQ
jgi:hypothetical protein